MPDVKGSMPAPVDTHSSRPTETPKDLKKRVRGLDKSLTNVHERLVQTEKQIFDLERSYLEETRLYGNVLQGWDAYLDIKGKEKGGEIVAGAKRGIKRAAAVKNEDGEDEIGEGGLLHALMKRTKGVELEERLFSLGSVTSPAAKGLQKLEEAKRKANAGGGGAGSSSGGGSAGTPKNSKDKKVSGKGGGGAAGGGGSGSKNSKKDSARKKKK
eukprot:jgi/Undpi1/13503/HiC_scaffold_8.g03162.m1